MKAAIAGHGRIGKFVCGLLEPTHGPFAIYDPPQGHTDESVLRDVDFVLVAVPTPTVDGRNDPGLVLDVAHLARPNVALLSYSTLPPGTAHVIEDMSGVPAVVIPEFGSGEFPEHPWRKIENRTSAIVGVEMATIGQKVKDFLRPAYRHDAEWYFVTPLEAEVVKWMENAFLSLKVGFVNEMYDLCETVGAEWERVREAWVSDWRVNPSHSFVTSERGFGGDCLPKDLQALLGYADDVGVDLQILHALARSNQMRRGKA